MKVFEVPLGSDVRNAIREVKAASYHRNERVVAEFNDYIIDSNKSEEDNMKDYRNGWNKAYIDGVDWEQRRYEIAKAVMVGDLAAPVVEGVDPNPSVPELVRHCVTLADALIEELKKEKQNE